MRLMTRCEDLDGTSQAEGVRPFPFAVLATALAVTLLAVGSLVLSLYAALVSLDEANARYQNATRMHGRIVHLDEVLTMSARMGAATGDPRWEARYRSMEPQLETAISRAVELAPSRDIAAEIQAVDAANRDLVRMEHEAFRLIREGRRAEAWTLLASQRYEREKLHYARGIADYSRRMDDNLAEHVVGARRQATFSVGVAAMVFPLALASWILTIRRMREWRQAILHNIAERKRMEAELRNLNESLDLRVARRTAELERANAELREAGRYKDEFLSVVTHELRTPLNFIIGFESILEDEVSGPLNEAQRRHLIGIRDGSQRMLAIVNNLLEFARIKAGKLALDFRDTLLEPVVCAVLHSFDDAAVDRGVTLSVDIALSLAAEVDEAHFVQVVSQLVDNALKFTPRGGRVDVSATLAGQEAVFSVRDTGIGIAPEDLPKLFLPFRQVDMTSTRRVGGTGLGLVIARAIIEAHGGEMGVKSQVGAGTTVWFTLPRAHELPVPAATVT